MVILSRVLTHLLKHFLSISQENEKGVTVGTIPRQPWSIRLPSITNANESKLVGIPQGQESPDLPLPSNVTHVSNTMYNILSF